MLIIEDGTQVANSNSFVTDLEYTTYAALKGLTIGVDAPAREIDLLAGMDYILSREETLQGFRVSSTQSVMYPRIGVWLFGYSVASDFIHDYVKNSQMEAAAYNTSGTLLSNTQTTNKMKEKVDVIEVEYFKGGSRSNVNLQRVDTYLIPLMEDTNKLVRT
jgi:hypothetical protein